MEKRKTDIPKKAKGRPVKYAEASRPVTMTLPERILNDLASLDEDRSKAIVRCVEATLQQADNQMKPVELIQVTQGKALIVVGPSSALRQIDWLQLIEIAPFRYLLVLPTGTAVETLEVTIQDMLMRMKENGREYTLLSDLRDILSVQRRGGAISKAELILIDIP
ncbi:MAG: hypothetical protein FWE89_03635 [Syntrophaceae bacterium]|nr:hypothetical protein [Syntrophaceae bacterium]